MIASEAGKLRETDRGEAALCNRRLVCRFLWLLQASRSRPLSYKPSMSDYLPLFFLMYLFWLFNSFNTSLCFCGCLPGSTTCPRSLCSHCKRCLSSEKMSHLDLDPHHLTCPTATPCPYFFPVSPSVSLGVPPSTELQAVIPENELCNRVSEVCASASMCEEIYKTNLLSSSLCVDVGTVKF